MRLLCIRESCNVGVLPGRYPLAHDVSNIEGKFLTCYARHKRSQGKLAYISSPEPSTERVDYGVGARAACAPKTACSSCESLAPGRRKGWSLDLEISIARPRVTRS